MLRVHFTAADFGRISVLPTPDPLWETVLSLMQLNKRRAPDDDLLTWQRDTRRVLRPPGRRHLVEKLSILAPGRGYFPDFLTPAGIIGLDHGVDEVMRTPKTRLRGEMARLAGPTGLPTWASDLADGSATRLAELGASLRKYHDLVVRPALAARPPDIGHQPVSGANPETVFTGLSRSLHWRRPVLYAPYPYDKDVYLAGRGLLLVPSYFCRRTPVTFADPDLEPVLVYPTAPSTEVTPQSLVALLGRTRAGALHALVVPTTTGELARRIAVSTASASEHATILRNSGLVVSTRAANTVLHTLTPLGHAVLDDASTRTRLER